MSVLVKGRGFERAHSNELESSAFLEDVCRYLEGGGVEDSMKAVGNEGVALRYVVSDCMSSHVIDHVAYVN